MGWQFLRTRILEVCTAYGSCCNACLCPCQLTCGDAGRARLHVSSARAQLCAPARCWLTASRASEAVVRGRQPAVGQVLAFIPASLCEAPCHICSSLCEAVLAIDNADLLRNADASRSVRAAPAGPTRFAAPDSEPMTPLRACRPSALRAAPRCASRAARSAWGDRDDRVGAEARRLAERATAEAEREVRGQLRVLACGLPWQLWPASEP